MCVAKAGWNGWIDILLIINLPVSIFWKYVLQLVVELVDSRRFAKIFFKKSTFSKYVCRKSWLNGWIGYFNQFFFSQNLILRGHNFQIYVCGKRWLNGWIDIHWNTISLVSIFWRHTSQTLVELVDSRRFANIFFKKVYF